MSEERVFLSLEEVEAMLPEGDTIHTFRNPAGVLIGADWHREDLIKHIKEYKPELSGGMAEGMNHGIVIIDNLGALFIATKKQENLTTPSK